MAYTVSVDERGYLHVHSTLYSFHDTKHEHWYFDVLNARQSSRGRLGDEPDRNMTESAFQWMVKHYIPKLEQLILDLTEEQAEEFNEVLAEVRAGNDSRALRIRQLMREADPQVAAIHEHCHTIPLRIVIRAELATPPATVH